MNEYDSIREHIPEEGWLAHFTRFTDDMEACPRFRFFAAACVLGAVANNKVWVHRGDPDILPKLFGNVWVLLLAPPGRGHKTSTINLACNIMVEAVGNEVRLLSDKLTPEALVKSLGAPQSAGDLIRIGPGDATGLVKAPELSVFFGKQQYNTGLVSLVTDLYDWRKQWSSTTIGRGKDVLKNVCISVLGGSTPTWLQTMLPEDAFTGGFMSRFILVEMPPSYYKRKPFPQKGEGSQFNKLIKELAQISKMQGEMSWTEGSRKVYTDICESQTPTGDVQTDAYKERETEQVLKLGISLALSERSLILEDRFLVRSHKLLKALEEETIPRIERLTTNPQQRIMQEMLDLIKMQGKISEIALLKMVARRLPGPVRGEQEFSGAIKMLKMTDEIDMKFEDKKTWLLPKKKGGDKK